MTDSRFEELLAEAIQEYGNEYIEVPEEMYKEHRFSKTFERRMRRILRKERGMRMPRRRISLRMLIAVIVTAILVVSGAALTAGALRTLIIGFTTDDQEKFTNVKVEPAEDDPDTIEEIYELTQMPEGYELVREERLDFLYDITYENEKGYYVIFTQCITAEYNSNYDTETIDMEPIEINLGNGFGIFDDNQGMIVWKRDGYIFEIAAIFNDDQHNAKGRLINMAETVQKVQNSE